MNKIIIKIIAITCAGIGIYKIIPDFRGQLWILNELVRGNNPYTFEKTWMNILAIGATIILYLRPVSGVGLFFLKQWGKNLTVVVLSIDFLISIIGFVHMWTYSVLNPEFEKQVEEYNKKLEADLAGGADIIIKTVSLIPEYIIALLSLISAIWLYKIKLNQLKE